MGTEEKTTIDERHRYLRLIRPRCRGFTDEQDRPAREQLRPGLIRDCRTWGFPELRAGAGCSKMHAASKARFGVSDRPSHCCLCRKRGGHKHQT